MVHPLPEERIRSFAKKVDELYVIEELDDVIESHVKKLGIAVHGKDIFPLCGEISQNMVAEAFGEKVVSGKALEEEIPVRPPVMCAGCPHRGLFYTLSKNKVYGVGRHRVLYAWRTGAAFERVDTTICMGASISGLHGFNKARGTESEHKISCSDRRQHFHALRYDGACQRGIQRQQLRRSSFSTTLSPA